MVFKVLLALALPLSLCSKAPLHWASSFSEQASSYLDAFPKYFPARFLGKNFFDLRNKVIISLNSLKIPYIALLQLHVSLCKHFSSVQFRSVAQSCLTLCNPMDCSTPGLPVHHHLPEFTQTHVHWVSDAIQTSHPLLSPSSPTFNLSQHQGLFKRVSSLNQVAKVLEFQFQHQSFQWTPRTDFL